MTDPSSDKDPIDGLLDSLQNDDPMNQDEVPLENPDDPDVKKVEIEPLKVHKSLDAPDGPVTDPSVDKLATELLNKVRTLTERAMLHFEEDRNEVQEVVDHYKKRLFDDTIKLSPIEHESLGSAMRIKTDATANMAKLGDMIAKVLSSGKSHLGGPAGSALNVEDLHKKLETPDYGDTPTNIDQKPSAHTGTPDDPE